jgi:hypothetical protein
MVAVADTTGLRGGLALTAAFAEFEAFAWSDWKPHGGDKMISPGGRVLGKAAFDRLSAAGKGKATAPKPAARPKSPPPATAGPSLGATRDDRLRSLTAMSKPQLAATAKAHGVTVPAGATAEQIRTAVAAKVAPAVTNGLARGLGLPDDPKQASVKQLGGAMQIMGVGRVVGYEPGGGVAVELGRGRGVRLTREQVEGVVYRNDPIPGTAPAAQLTYVRPLGGVAARPAAPATSPTPPSPAKPAFDPPRFGAAGPALPDPKAEYAKQDAEYVSAVKEFDRVMATGRAAEQVAARGRIVDALVNRAEAAKALPDPPEPTQFELDRVRAVIEARDGKRPAGVLHAAAWALAKAAPLLAGAGGAGAGAGVGAAVGSLAGPVGTGVGAAVGTLIGGFLGGKVGKYAGSPRRFLAGVRRLARQTLPAAAGTLGGAGTAAVAWPLGVGLGAALGPVNLTLGAMGSPLFDEAFRSIGDLFAAPGRMAEVVYQGTAGLVEGSAAKGRKRDGTVLPRTMAEAPAVPARDVVAEVKAMLTQAGVSPVPPDAVIAFAVGSAALAEDGWFDGDDHEAFMWQPQRTRRGHPKAVWAGAGQKEPLYGQDAVDALAGQEKRRTRVEAVAAGAKKAAGAVAAGAKRVAAAAKTADAAVGKAAGKAGEKMQAGRKRLGAKAKAMAVEGKFGGLVKWLAESQVGARVAVELERRAERVDATAKDMAEKGYVKGQVEGGRRAFGYLARKFTANRRRYGLIPALGIEAATFLIAKGIPVALTLGTAAAGAAIGTAAGGIGVGAGAVGGMLLGGAAAKRFLRLALGPVYAHLGRATAETAAAAVARRVRPASAARDRKRAGRVAALTPAAVGAMAESAAPTVLDLVAAVKKELAARCRLAGVVCPEVSDGRVLRSLDAALDAIRAGGRLSTAG